MYVEMPEVDTELEKGEQLTVLESVKAVAEVYTSVSGKVTEVNEELENSPNLINEHPFGKGLYTIIHTLSSIKKLLLALSLSIGWLAKLEVSNAEEELADLMTQEQYNQHISEGSL